MTCCIEHVLQFNLGHHLLFGGDRLIWPPQVVIGQQAVATGRFATMVGGQVGRQSVKIGPRVADRLLAVAPSHLELDRLKHILRIPVTPQNALHTAQQNGPLMDQQLSQDGGIGSHARSL